MGVAAERECDDPVMWPSQRLHTQKVLWLFFFHFVLLIPPTPLHICRRGALISIYKMRARIKQAGFIIQECRL